MKKQLDDEVQHLTSSYTSLRQAQQKFRDCIVSIKTGVADSVAGPSYLTASPLYTGVQRRNA